MHLQPGEDFHHFAGAESFVQDLPMGDGKSARYLKFRINTVILDQAGETPSCTQWVFVPLDAMEQLSAQLAAVAESAKRWIPGEEFQSVGENIGVMNTTDMHC